MPLGIPSACYFNLPIAPANASSKLIRSSVAISYTNSHPAQAANKSRPAVLRELNRS